MLKGLLLCFLVLFAQLGVLHLVDQRTLSSEQARLGESLERDIRRPREDDASSS